MLAGATTLLALAAAASMVAADKVYGPSSTSSYANGQYGDVPSQSFYSRPDLLAPAINVATSKEGQAPGLIFTNWEGSECPRNQPYITDSAGHMVWMPDSPYLTHVSSYFFPATGVPAD